MLKTLAKALSARGAAWESLCRRCGLCCFQKEVGRGILHIDFRAPCRYLDESTRLCAVYERRFKVCPECRRMTVFQALFARYLPITCGYVREFRGARGGEAAPRG